MLERYRVILRTGTSVQDGFPWMRPVLAWSILLGLVAVSCEPAEVGRFPRRDLRNVVVWAAGGGTDICNRIISAEMGKILGVNINVISKPGGVGGSVGMSEVYSRPHDGYTLCGLSESCVTAAVQGGWEQRMDVWDFFIVGGSPDLISVSVNTPYQSLEELIEAAKANPRSVRTGASAAGSIHHLNLLALEKGTGARLNFIPYPGSVPAQNAAMTGEVQAVITSLAEQQALIRGGRLRPLAMLIPTPFEVAEFGAIPSAFDLFPELSEHLPISQAIGFAVPTGVPAEVKSALADAFRQAMKSEAILRFARENHYILSGLSGPEAKREFLRLESLFAWTLWRLGAAKVDPGSLGIPEPE